MADRSRVPARTRFVLAAVLVGLVSACSPFDDLMVSIFGRSMRDQRSFDPYENTLLPPEGAAPFAAGNFSIGPDRIAGGLPEAPTDLPPPFTQVEVISQAPVVMELANPVEATPASLAEGERLFNRFCAPCHGTDGIGANAPISVVHPMLPAINLASPVTAARPDGYLYAVIRVGRALMPAYGHQIPNHDRWHIVNYIRQLQAQAGITAPGE